MSVGFRWKWGFMWLLLLGCESAPKDDPTTMKDTPAAEKFHKEAVAAHYSRLTGHEWTYDMATGTMHAAPRVGAYTWTVGRRP